MAKASATARVVAITGVTRGLGRALAEGLARRATGWSAAAGRPRRSGICGRCWGIRTTWRNWT